MTATAPLLTIHHKTEYRYAYPVSFGEHRIMLRPQDGHDLRVVSARLEISPTPEAQHNIHDVFGNSVTIATFGERASRLTFDYTVTVEHFPPDSTVLTPDNDAYFYPFLYEEGELPDLTQYITPQYADPDGTISEWGRKFLSDGSTTSTQDLLTNITHAVRSTFVYRKRHEQGTQHPLDTLYTRSGTCRDYALFMIEVLRRLGIAARFVSGYLVTRADRSRNYFGGGSTHAWVQVYLPDAGWVEFDPTNGIIGSRDLIRVAVARDPSQAIPLHGTYMGTADAHLSLDVTVDVTTGTDVEKV